MESADFGVAEDVRSPVGHAAVSMKGTNDRWVQIQLNTFTNWVNEQLHDTDSQVVNLIGDLCDGIKLCYLLEVIQGRKIGRIIKKPMNQHHYIENVNLAIKAMVNDNIKLVNIGSEDIVNGNPKLTMALIWHLILRYQIGKSKVPPKKLMLSWINAVIPDLNITNFSTDWNDGIALQALIEYCKPGTYPNWRQTSRKDGLKNCREAMQLAKQYFGIPLVLSPENLSSPDLDELSGMTYLSYFMKVDSPGYKATLGWIRGQVPQQNVKNFQSCWNDGTTLTALVKKLGGDVPKVNSNDPETIINAAMLCARGLGVEPVISAKEMADPEVDHLGVMAYAAWFQRVKSRKPEPRKVKVEKVIPLATRAPSPAPPPPAPPVAPPKPRTPPENMIEILWRQRDVYIRKPVTFTLEGQDDDVDKTRVRVEVIGPRGSKPHCELTWSGQKAHGVFTPPETGTYKVVVYYGDVVVRGTPLTMEAKVDINTLKFTKPNAPSQTGTSTAITISAADVRRGAVVVNATSPSGKTHRMTVQEKNGVYTANFTPTEVGDWNIAILYDGQHIQGSPFDVRVYDASRVRVLDLRGGAVGKMFAFTVKADGAGEGKLDVNIVHNGMTIPATIIPTNPALQQFDVQFTPPSSGLYTIRVFFGGMEVPNSPFKLEIIDSNAVTATGRGLTSTAINTSAEFVVNTGTTAKDGDLRVEITAPSGAKVANQVIDNNNGTYTVRYVVSEVGEYIIDVYFYGKPIKGSPYRVQSYDLASIHVTVPSIGIVDKLVEFDINAARAGSGNLEIMVNEGRIPCSVQNRGNRQFHASFLPRSPGVHYIQMKFNGQLLYNSPWRVDVKSAANMTVGGSGLQMVPVNSHACFEVKTGGLDHGDVRINITSPSGRLVPSTIRNLGRGDYSVEYIPVEVGNHLVEVTYDGIQLPGSPFTSKAYDVNAIVIQPVTGGIVGGHVEFTVDVSMAGEGQLEIMVDGGTIPNHVSMIRKGVFKVDFVPREARPHKVDVRFNGLNAPASPFMVPVMDTNRITAVGDGLRHTSVNKQAFFRVNTQAAGGADLAVKVTSPSGRQVHTSVIGSPETGFDVDFTPVEVGSYRVDIEYGKIPIPGSPFYCKVYDGSKVKVRDVSDGIVGVKSAFLVDIDDSGEGSLEISISGPSGNNLHNQVHQLAAGRFEVSYTPVENGPHKANILFNKQHIPGSPFHFTVIDASQVKAVGDGLGLVPCNRSATFSVHAPGARARDLIINILDPEARPVPTQVFESTVEKGQFTVEYTPIIPGEYKVEMLYFGKLVPGSPFIAKAWDASKVSVSNISPGRIGKPSYFKIDASRAGAGNLEIVVSCGSENVPNFVKAEDNARFEVSFTPVTIDTHTINIKFNGDLVPGCPIMWEPADMPHMHSLGAGLLRVPAGRKAVITVDPRKSSMAGSAVVEVHAPSNRVFRAHVTPIPNQGLFKAEFIPREIGPHCIMVLVGDIEIQGSPFACEVYDISKVKVKHASSGVVGKPVDVEIDSTRAGVGEIEAVVRVDGRHKVPSKLIDKAFGIKKLSFLPKDCQPHAVHVFFSQEVVPGSPFIIDIEDSTMVFAYGRSLESAPVGERVTFDIDPSKALFRADIHLKIIGPPPDYQEVPYFLRGNYIEGWQVEWHPLEIGVYNIELKYGDSHVMGSPFKCKVYDLSKVKIIRERQTYGTEGILGDVVFYVDASEAGAGNLEVVVRSRRDGTRIPNFLEADVHPGHFKVYFTPKPHIYNYEVEVMFNERNVKGSPFYHAIIDGSRATASGPGLKLVAANKPTYFDVYTQGISGEAPLQVDITGPHGHVVPSHVTGTSKSGFRVEYVPKEVGVHQVRVLFADVNIQGSPFMPEVYDAGQVKVGHIPQGVLGQPIKFDVDTSSAGSGKLTAEVKGHSTAPPCEIVSHANGHYVVSFEPREVVPHHVNLMFNGDKVPGSPFMANVFDWNNIVVNWEAANLVPVNKPVMLTLDPHGAPEADIEATVTDPYGKEVLTQISRKGAMHQILFTPLTVGLHSVNVTYGKQPVVGSPGSCNVHDATRVRLTDVTQPGLVKQEMGFTVDTTEAGIGDLDVEVYTQAGHSVMVHHQQLDQFRQRFTFMPQTAVNHTAEITFNYQRIPGVPLIMGVFDRDSVRVNWEAARLVPVNKPVVVDIDPRGAPPSEVISQVTDPSGKEIITTVRRHGDIYQVMFTPVMIGPHVMTLTYGGQVVRGSPFTLNAYDTARVRITEASRMGALRQEVGLTVDTSNAGEGVLMVEVQCQGRLLITKEASLTQHSRHFTFMPVLAETHEVFVTFNREPVNGSPFEISVFDPNDIKVIWDVLHQVPVSKPVTFILDPCGIPDAPVDAEVIDPEGSEILGNIRKDGSLYKLTFTPMIPGTHKVTFAYSGQTVPGSPFICMAYDLNEIKVTDITEKVILGEECHFTVDLGESGYTGEVGVEVTCQDRPVQTRYFPIEFGQRKFTFSPLVAAEHVIDVVLFEERPKGVPFTVHVIDFGELLIDYAAARSVPLGALAHIYLDPRGYPGANVEAKCTDQNGKEVPLVLSRIEGKFRIELNPESTGVYTFHITFCGKPVPGSPHKCTVYSADRIKIIDLRQYSSIGEEVTFTVDLTEVGDGELSLHVTCEGQTLPLRHHAITRYRHQFTFVPQLTSDHQVHIYFNKEPIPSSPYVVHMFDVKNVTTDWDSMRPVPVNKVVIMKMDPKGLPESSIDVVVIDPSSQRLVPRVYHDGSVYKIEFTPIMVGLYNVHILYGGVTIPGSPFVCTAYDISKVYLKEVPSAVLVGQEASFLVSLQDAGQGLLGAEILHAGQPVSYQHYQVDHVTHKFTFVPMATGEHLVLLHYNGEPVMGAPFNIGAYDTNQMTVNTEAVRLIPVNQPITVELDPRGVPESTVEVKVTDLTGSDVPYQMTKQGGVLLIEFVPRRVGLYSVDIRCGGQLVPGSPFQCNVFDASRVQITDITEQGLVREEMGFTVHTGEAGQGELEAELTNSGSPLQLTQRRLNQNTVRFSFIPSSPGDHKVNIKYNKMPVPNTPFMMNVYDPRVKLTVRTDPDMKSIRTGSTGVFYIQRQGGITVNMKDVKVQVIGPNGQLVPAQILQQPDGDYKVEYSSKYTGRHTVEILYNNQPIMGSPFYVEIYDPNKVIVTGTPEGTVGVPMSIDIITKDAGKANLALNIVSPSGRNVPYTITKMADGSGDVVEYVPMEAGPHQIYITYGDLDVAGTPITQNIVDTAALVNAFGQGLQTAEKGQPAKFMIDTKGKRGNIEVQVKGTHTISQVQLDPVGTQFQASYVPMETGLFQVSILWNGQPISGSPFHVNVTEPFDINSITPVGGWQAVLDSEGKMYLKSRVINTIEFDTSRATHCTLTATVESPTREVVPVTVEKMMNGTQTTLSFVPRTSGLYQIRVFCNDICLPRCPIPALATDPVDHEKVVLTGLGLQEAIVNQQAEFIIDGTEAGPGEPNVKLTGVKKDIPVHLEPIGANKYKATYVPVIPGAYLLSITWNNRLVRGSPFKVNIKSGANASKVSVNTDGFRQSVFGKEIKAIIDTRRAGPGELTAHCMGPNKVAYCELLDHRDGTFTLNIRPQEPGKHILQVKYGGEHVPGSPFLLKVAGPPDASKVRVSGPGVESGILATFQSRFIVETRGAGAGQLTVRIRGPKGAFRVEMQRESQKDRTILCRYDPTEVGTYIIHVKWSGEHVPGSPFTIQIFDTMNELTEYLANNQNRVHRPYLDSDQWSENL